MDRNGLNDESASIVLKGFTNKAIKKLTLASNELGKESIVIIDEKIAKNLTELRMCHLKISRLIQKEFGLGFEKARKL